MSIYKKLLTIQQKINGLGKDKKAFSYQYVTGDKVLGEIKPLMNELGLLLKQEILSIENTRQDYTTKNGAKAEILSKVLMRFTWIDSDTGEMDENLFGANGQNDWDKGVGSALTYAERYFLLKYFHIATDEDDIDNEQRKEPVKAAEKAPAKAAVPKADLKPLMEAAEILMDCKAFNEKERKAYISIIGKTINHIADGSKDAKEKYNALMARIKAERENREANLNQ